MSSSALGILDIIDLGESWKPRFQLKNASRTAVDLTATGVTLQLRLGLAGANITTRTSGVSGEYAYTTDGTDGDVSFLFSPAVIAALAVGTYDVEIVYTGTEPLPDDKNVVATGTLTVKTPTTGTL